MRNPHQAEKRADVLGCPDEETTSIPVRKSQGGDLTAWIDCARRRREHDFSSTRAVIEMSRSGKAA